MVYFVLFMFQKCQFSGSIINCMLKHKKLPLLHCYHIFSKTRGVYLAKNHYKHYSPRWYRPTLMAHGLDKSCRMASVGSTLLKVVVPFLEVSKAASLEATAKPTMHLALP